LWVCRKYWHSLRSKIPPSTLIIS